MSDMNLKCFTCEELNDATNRVEEELGRGASVTVFKGVLVELENVLLSNSCI